MFDSELQDEWQPPTYNIRAGLAAPPLLSKTSLAPDPECKHNFARTLQWLVQFHEHGGTSLNVVCQGARTAQV